MQHYPYYPKRNIISLEGIWAFRFFEGVCLEEAVKPDVTTNDFINVPGAFDVCPDYYCKRGTVLYRRTLELANDAEQVLLKAGGIGLRGRFFLDGNEIGSTDLPYSTLLFATGPLKAGTHTLSVWIDNQFDSEKMKQFYPFYDFYAFGGIYQNIELHLLPSGTSIDRVQVRTLDLNTGKVELHFLWNGLTTEKIDTEIKFDTEDSFHKITLLPGENTVVFSVPGFRLWSPETPNLHTVTVRCGEDCIIERFGIRTISAGKKRILVNGKPVYLKGFNRHESHQEFGPAIPPQLMIEDLQNLRAMHCNFIRGCHYPQDQRFLDLCDVFGFLVWEESLGWGNRDEQLIDKGFIEAQIRATRQMIRTSVNHPSVIFWAFLNEFGSDEKAGYDLCKKLVDTIKAEDSTRIVTFACNRTDKDICTPLVDIVAYNTYPGWIGTDSDNRPQNVIIKTNQEKILEFFRSLNGSNKPVMVSEMGCCGIYGAHDRANAQWTEEFQSEYLNDVINIVFSSEDICGLCIWQMNDAKSYHRQGGIRQKPFSYNLAGVFDRYRRPKLAVATVTELFKGKE